MEVFEATSGYSAISLKVVLIALIFVLLAVFCVITYIRTKTVPSAALRVAGVLVAIIILVEAFRPTM